MNGPGPDLRPLLIGATGTVGNAVMASLRARGVLARALVRSSRAEALLLDGITPVHGDLHDRAGLDAAMNTASAVFFVAPHEHDEEALAQNVIEACERASRRLVFVGVHVDSRFAFVRAALRRAFGALHPHYHPKTRIAERVRNARCGAVVITPTNFFQNDEVFRDDILGGAFTSPLNERGVNRVDVRDVGDAVARALCEPEAIPPGAYSVFGTRSYNGRECAAIWSRVLGRRVEYRGRDRARWTATIERQLTGKKREDWIATFGVLARMRLPTDRSEVARSTVFTGHAPRAYEDYVRETAAAWTSSQSSK